ncbi:ATP-binding protein [Leptospira vanthielii]|uniref:Histidine kinase-like ATPase domain protein n=1 Tax=Leptospira vanthielii serovar Holland str. Waz Holland = ATCC 700522 TaxID=1218591 RepID=N1W1W0_9LEPT|nr:ATP-binding protein [Leptospira vanthielii]EMY70209.1 histidine kinase-like ATPase domain protein [Leptospira vanthielii serovar Holland str. Waz Holland = ATCC 700522]
MKTSFSILAAFFCIGDLTILSNSLFLENKILSQPHTIATYLVFLSFILLYFGLQFPTFFRNFPRLVVICSFVLGMGIMLLFVDLGLLNEVYPNTSLILLKYYYNTYYVLAFLAFAYLIIAKLRYNFPAIQKFMEYIYFTSFVTCIFFGSLCFFPNVIPLTTKYFLHFFLFLNLLFLSCFIVFLFHYSFTENYLTHPFSVIFERSTKIFEDQVLATRSHSRLIKEKLWSLYDSRNWRKIMDSFWFQILVDETLDNALEHGGKREDDIITVHVFESRKYIDVYVIDSGKGFNPRLVPSPIESDRKLVTSGRGIHILKKLFVVRWNFLGNEVSIRVDKTKSNDWKSVT